MYTVNGFLSTNTETVPNRNGQSQTYFGERFSVNSTWHRYCEETSTPKRRLRSENGWYTSSRLQPRLLYVSFPKRLPGKLKSLGWKGFSSAAKLGMVAYTRPRCRCTVQPADWALAGQCFCWGENLPEAVEPPRPPQAPHIDSHRLILINTSTTLFWFRPTKEIWYTFLSHDANENKTTCWQLTASCILRVNRKLWTGRLPANTDLWWW